MAKIPINDPKHWRERAGRSSRSQISDRDTKKMMLRIAEDYDKLAKYAERRLREASK